MGNLGTLYTGCGFWVLSEKKSGKPKMRYLNQHNFVATWSLILKFLHGADLVLKRSNPGRNGSIQSCGFCISRTERRTRSFWNHPAVRALLGRLNNGATAELHDCTSTTRELALNAPLRSPISPILGGARFGSPEYHELGGCAF